LNQEMNHVIHQREKNKNRFRKKVEWANSSMGNTKIEGIPGFIYFFGIHFSTGIIYSLRIY
jgi:hypothetical protein